MNIAMSSSDVFKFFFALKPTGVLRAYYYEGCEPLGSLTQVTESLEGESFTLQQCRDSCDSSVYRYAAIEDAGDDKTCYCLAAYSKSNTYTEATCGNNSLYILSSFQSTISDPLDVRGFTVSFDGIELNGGNHTVIAGINVNVSFSISSGEDVFYSIYGDNRLGDITTSDVSTYLVFPQIGLYYLTAKATNQISKMEKGIWVNADENVMQSGNLFVEIAESYILTATSELVSIHIETVINNNLVCSWKFGDGPLTTETRDGYHFDTHRYGVAGVFTVEVGCDTGSLSAVDFAQITVQERVAITLNTTYRSIQGSILAIPFRITGTNITDRVVLYDGQSLTNFTCVGSSCEGFIGTALTGTHILEVGASNLISGSVISKAFVYVGAPLTNFSNQISATAVTPDEAVNLTACVAGSTPVSFYFKFGESLNLLICELVPCVLSFSESFSQVGDFAVSVQVSNELDALKSEIYSVKVYYSVPALNMVVINSSSTHNPVVLNIYPTPDTSAWPTDASVTFSIDGFQNELTEDFIPSPEAESSLTYFLNIPAYGRFNITVQVSNAISSVLIQDTVQVGEAIAGFYGGLLSTQAPGDNVSFEFVFTTGSDVTFNVDFGDGTNKTISPDGEEVGGDNLTITGSFLNTSMATREHNSPTTRTVYHIYSKTGDYTIKHKAENIFGAIHRALLLSVINRINGLRLRTNGTHILTWSPVQIVLYLERGVATPQMVQCIFDYDDDGHHSDILERNLSDSTNLTVQHTYDSPQRLQVKASCANVISNVTLTVNLVVRERASGCSISSSTQISPTDKIMLFNTSVSTGSDLTLLIQFGDGSVDLANMSGTYSRTFQKVYQQAGIYTVNLTAWNPSSSCVAYGVPVIVQVPIPENGCHLQINQSTVDISNPTSFTITFNETTPMPTKVSALWKFGDRTSYLQFIPTGTIRFSTSHRYNKTGRYNVSVNLSNMVSVNELRSTLVVREQIRDLDYGISTNAAAVGANITLWIRATSGTSITYKIDYGDGCTDTKFQEKPHNLTLIHSYGQLGTYIPTVRAMNDLSEIIRNHMVLIVAYPVRGLTLQVGNSEAILGPGIVTFSLTLDPKVPPPTGMECIWDWADGTNNDRILTMENATITSGESLNTTHNFPGGHFVVVSTCGNILGNLSLQRDIYVYEDVKNLEIGTLKMTAGVDSGVLFTVTTTNGSLVHYFVQFGDGQSKNRSVIMSSNTKRQNFYHAFATPGVYLASVRAGNILGQSTATLNASIVVMYSTHALQLSSDSPITLPTSLITFTIAPVQGANPPSSVRLQWNFGDGTTRDEQMDFNTSYSVSTTHLYNSSGTYHAAVIVTNKLDFITLDTTVVINPEIDVSFKFIDGTGSWIDGLGPDFNWFPSGSEVKLCANSTLNGTFIRWEFSSGEVSDLEIIHRRYEHPGAYNITLQVDNGTAVLQEMHYVFYIVGPFHLSSIEALDETGLLILKSDQRVDLTLFGSGLDGAPLCIAWDVGDQSRQTVYGPDPCERTILQNNSVYMQSELGAGEHFSHVYTTPGYYNVNVSVTTFFKTTQISKEITVSGCLCSPMVTIRGPGETIVAPRSHRSSEAIRFESEVSLECIGIISTSFTWKVYKLANNETHDITNSLPTVNSRQLDLTPGLLEVGLYQVWINATIEDYTVYDIVFISIEPSPLVLILEGGSSKTVGNAHHLVLDALKSSHDPDDRAGNASSWTFNWSCQKVSNYSQSPPPNPHPCDNLSWNQLNFTDAVIGLDPTELIPGAKYIFRVEAALGSRTASYEQTVEIVDGEPPQISIRQENFIHFNLSFSFKFRFVGG